MIGTQKRKTRRRTPYDQSANEAKVSGGPIGGAVAAQPQAPAEPPQSYSIPVDYSESPVDQRLTPFVLPTSYPGGNPALDGYQPHSPSYRPPNPVSTNTWGYGNYSPEQQEEMINNGYVQVQGFEGSVWKTRDEAVRDGNIILTGGNPAAAENRVLAKNIASYKDWNNNGRLNGTTVGSNFTPLLNGAVQGPGKFFDARSGQLVDVRPGMFYGGPTGNDNMLYMDREMKTPDDARISG